MDNRLTVAQDARRRFMKCVMGTAGLIILFKEMPGCAKSRDEPSIPAVRVKHGSTVLEATVAASQQLNKRSLRHRYVRDENGEFVYQLDGNAGDFKYEVGGNEPQAPQGSGDAAASRIRLLTPTDVHWRADNGGTIIHFVTDFV